MFDIKEEVRRKYGEIAARGACAPSCCEPSRDGSGTASVAVADPVQTETVAAGCCGAERRAAPEEAISTADLGLSCGLPTAEAGILPGETVLDLGSGAGVDAFRAAAATGPRGRVIGVDMTPGMVTLARSNAEKSCVGNVEFREGDIESLPVEDGSVDVVLSNCVINLAPDKRRVFEEIHRVLRPGGRFSISDIVSVGDVPEEIRRDAAKWTGCIAGAMDRDEYLSLIRESGFGDVAVTELSGCCSPEGEGYGFTSITIRGRKG